jgi:hypothetical protein
VESPASTDDDETARDQTPLEALRAEAACLETETMDHCRDRWPANDYY